MGDEDAERDDEHAAAPDRPAPSVMSPLRMRLVEAAAAAAADRESPEASVITAPVELRNLDSNVIFRGTIAYAEPRDVALAGAGGTGGAPSGEAARSVSTAGGGGSDEKTEGAGEGKAETARGEAETAIAETVPHDDRPSTAASAEPIDLDAESLQMQVAETTRRAIHGIGHQHVIAGSGQRQQRQREKCQQRDRSQRQPQALGAPGASSNGSLPVQRLLSLRCLIRAALAVGSAPLKQVHNKCSIAPAQDSAKRSRLQRGKQENGPLQPACCKHDLRGAQCSERI